MDYGIETELKTGDVFEVSLDYRYLPLHRAARYYWAKNHDGIDEVHDFIQSEAIRLFILIFRVAKNLLRQSLVHVPQTKCLNAHKKQFDTRLTRIEFKMFSF